MTDIFAEIEEVLDIHYTASAATKGLMHNRQNALCLAEIVFATYFFADHGVSISESDKAFLLQREPELAGSWTGQYIFVAGDPMNAVTQQKLKSEEQVGKSLADWIQSSAEVATVCWNLARVAAKEADWVQEDFIYDCLVYLRFYEQYEFYTQPWFAELEVP